MEADIVNLRALALEAQARWRAISLDFAADEAFAALKAAHARGEIVFGPGGNFKGTITGDKWMSWFEWAASKIEANYAEYRPIL
jgi:hypothetical protein